MKRTITVLLLIVLAVALCFSACNDPEPVEKLETPRNIYVVPNGVVTWRKVDGAEKYELNVNGTVYTAESNSFDLMKTPFPSGGVYKFQIRALGEEKNSDWSAEATFSYSAPKMALPKLSVEEGKLCWQKLNNNPAVGIVLNGAEITLPAGTAEYDLAAITFDSEIKVRFLGDGALNADSDYITVLYSATEKTLALPAPQNVRMDGMTLLFDKVAGADVYYLEDTQCNVTQITAGQSDRTGKLLVKRVWAASKNGAYNDSASANVTYFTKEQGLGTAESPYLVSTAAQLRYVEYYESLNLAKHYKLTEDIVLPQHVPAWEEEYSNFYCLGSLSGVIDGDGHKLQNSVTYYRDGYSSLFDTITASGVVKNLVIDNANWRTWTNRTNDGIMHEKGGECAILAYTNRGTVDNVTVTNSYVYAAKDGAAALVSVNRGTVKNCVVEDTTDIFGANEAGGIVIFNLGTVTDCINRGRVGGNTTVGGIAGRNNGTVTRCGNEGSVTANVYGGGIVGYNYNIYDNGLLFDSTVSLCYNSGEINVTSYAGGIVGKNGGNGLNEVGKMSYANAGVFSCYNTGTICGAHCLGGIVGDNYGYHENSTDLGVVNCYNAGEISVDLEPLKSTRIYVSFADCSWGSDEFSDFYVHYWSPDVSSAWPGVRMTATVAGTYTYYYADIGVKAEELTGVKFSKVNPYTGAVTLSTDDVLGEFKTGFLLFKIDSDEKGATASASGGLVLNANLAVGGVAGFNNMINDCYFVPSKVNYRTLTAGIESGSQFNKIQIGGAAATSADCAITDWATLLSALNACNDVWTQGEKSPILKWQDK